MTIWNLAGDTRQDIIKISKQQGSRVEISAGYAEGKYGKLCSSEIFQPLFDRINVTDYVLTLSCLEGLGVIHANLCAMTLSKGYDYAGVIERMSQDSSSKFIVGNLTPKLSQNKNPRGKTFFGNVRKYIKDIASDNNTQWFMKTVDGKSVMEMTSLDDEFKGVVQFISPDTGLIGTPQQVSQGVLFRTLLNPTIQVQNPPQVIAIDQQLIRQMKINYGGLAMDLDQDGRYKVIRVVHSGDTRGNEWYTDVVCVNSVGKVSSLLPYFYGK